MAATAPIPYEFTCFILKEKSTIIGGVSTKELKCIRVGLFTRRDIDTMGSEFAHATKVYFKVIQQSFYNNTIWILSLLSSNNKCALGYGFRSPEELKSFMRRVLPAKAHYAEISIPPRCIDQFMREHCAHIPSVVPVLDFLSGLKPVPPPPVRSPPATPEEIAARFDPPPKSAK